MNLLWPILCSGVLVLLHNYARSGSPLESFPGYFQLYTTGEQGAALAGSSPLDPNALMFGSWPGEYLLPALFGAGKGLFWYSPILWLLVLWVHPRARAWHPALTLGLLPWASFLLFIGSIQWVLTEGGWGPRYLLPLTPFLVLAGGYGIAPLASRPGMARVLCALTICAAIFQAFIAFEGNNHILAQNKVVAARLGKDPGAYGQYSLLLGRLRNLGVGVFDDPEFVRTWHSPEVVALAARTEDQLWWLKLGTKTSSPLVKRGLIGGGLALLILGILLLGRACLPMRRRPAPDPAPTR